jgi:hypothetical protein
MSISISIGSDHAGFELKKQIIDYLKNKLFIVITGTPCHERVLVRGANAPPTNVAGGQHARGTAHESSDAAAVAQATTRPCSPALPLVAARLHGCHDNLDSRSWRLPPTGTQAQIRNPAGRGARRIRRWRMVWG